LNCTVRRTRLPQPHSVGVIVYVGIRERGTSAG